MENFEKSWKNNSDGKIWRALTLTIALIRIIPVPNFKLWFQLSKVEFNYTFIWPFPFTAHFGNDTKHYWLSIISAFHTPFLSHMNRMKMWKIEKDFIEKMKNIEERKRLKKLAREQQASETSTWFTNKKHAKYGNDIYCNDNICLCG